MIQPELRFAVEKISPGRGRAVRVPSAGHLGVIEEKCSEMHGDEMRPGLNRLRAVGGWVCLSCGATV